MSTVPIVKSASHTGQMPRLITSRNQESINSVILRTTATQASPSSKLHDDPATIAFPKTLHSHLSKSPFYQQQTYIGTLFVYCLSATSLLASRV